ncbi:MAG: hypothetical protein M9921_00210 [Fimbriimonadaceae bacterium]|nr:hypothetical protein [Chthonomonadaceae bacterium]MCO5295259.1 hypothetical protein [Fimbriimonadaceae bacterium]
MRFQDQAVRMTQRALDDICRAARAVPEDKREWVPMGAARSVLDQMQEIAAAAPWFLPILRERKMPVFDAHAKREAVRLRQTHATVEDCILAAQSHTALLCGVIESMEDEHLEEEIELPFGGGMKLSLADVCMLHHNNMQYHLGQINQIQLMLGDREMH